MEGNYYSGFLKLRTQPILCKPHCKRMSGESTPQDKEEGYSQTFF